MQASPTADADGARSARTFVLADPGAPVTEVVAVEEFENRYNDHRVVIDAPAPWESPDELTPFNEVIKSLSWDEYHYSFEDRAPGIDLDGAWLIDADGLGALRSVAEEEGYEWSDRRDDPAPTVPRALVEAIEYLDLGDEITVRYDSARSDNELSKVGAVVAPTGVDEPDRPARITIHRDDDNYNRVIPEDGTASIKSNSRYPHMGRVLSITVEPQES